MTSAVWTLLGVVVGMAIGVLLDRLVPRTPRHRFPDVIDEGPRNRRQPLS